MSKLINGKEAYHLIGDGVEIEARVELKENLWRWEDAKHLPACDILSDGFDFRLKPHTITINGIELPAPFEPEEDELYWYITDSERGYSYAENRHGFRVGIAAWRTEEEIKQVVAALRCVFRGES